ncbi:Uncharacterised protein [Salmonella enterica subsp. arizonae]|uniref:Uncharacterized protein n=1 Tax=Salmonella enterica subsp. arizonae TaxID=59203 RepID=A0A379TLQ3_SALER|nr:Uncharacterised protein [Salmonella enterica subsp. arizonae]
MCFGHCPVRFFTHEEVLMTAPCHLWQVSDAHDLGGFAKLTQEFTDHGGGWTADANINFVKK